MKTTKFIKVSTADRLPEENTWVYFNSKSKPNLFLEYYVENKKQMILNLTGFWLDEKPDHEDEMREMLEFCIGYMPYSEKQKLKELLTKIKES